MLGSQVVILITIAVYLIAMVLIGVYFGKRAAATAAMTLPGRPQDGPAGDGHER